MHTIRFYYYKIQKPSKLNTMLFRVTNMAKLKKSKGMMANEGTGGEGLVSDRYT